MNPSAEKAEQIVERTLSPAFGFEQLGRLFTLDRHFDGWKQELEKALNSYQGPRAAPGRKLQQAQWEEQQNQIRKEKNIEQHPAGALYAFDFSNCAPIHQQVLLGPFLSLTRSKYVHEAIKFAQTTPLKVHATLLGPPEKMDTWSEQLGFQHVWCNRWPQWSWQKILNPGFSLENYFLGAGSVPELFYQRQQRIYPA